MTENTPTPAELLANRLRADAADARRRGGDWMPVAPDQIDAVLDHGDALAAILAEAPHGQSCMAYGDRDPEGWATVDEWCNCWKSKLPAGALAERDARVLREAAERVLAEARRSADAQRAHDDAEGIKPIGTSTANEVEWHQMGNWAHRILTADADRIEREAQRG